MLDRRKIYEWASVTRHIIVRYYLCHFRVHVHTTDCQINEATRVNGVNRTLELNQKLLNIIPVTYELWSLRNSFTSFILSSYLFKGRTRRK